MGSLQFAAVEVAADEIAARMLAAMQKADDLNRRFKSEIGPKARHGVEARNFCESCIFQTSLQSL